MWTYVMWTYVMWTYGLHSNKHPYLQLQVNWMKHNGFGGWMVWDLDMDDFDGNFCGRGRYPLISKLNEFLTDATTGATTTVSPPIASRTTTRTHMTSSSTWHPRSTTTANKRTPEDTLSPVNRVASTLTNAHPASSQITIPATSPRSPYDITTADSTPQPPSEAGGRHTVTKLTRAGF